jgi:transglutaminase-like putative cysteine protease
MRFRAVHKLMSYLLAAAAVATLTTSGAVPPATLLLLSALGVLSWFVEPGTLMGKLLDRAGLVFNVVALAFFALSLFQVFESFPEPEFGPILNVVLFLLGYKLFHRRSNRDYLWIYVLSFVLVLAAAWLAQTVFFLVGFVAYVVLSTWTLILFHLRREIEDNYLVKHLPESGSEKVTAVRVLNSRRVVGRSFFLVTGLLALGVFAGSALIFALVPRIGLGFFSGTFRRKVNIVGFSDEVTLGHHGVISGDNDTVVLWVRLPALEAMQDEAALHRSIQNYYWRGSVYDTYIDGKWQRPTTDSSRTLLDPSATLDGGIVAWLRSPEAPVNQKRPREEKYLKTFLEQEINVVGLSTPVAFALDEPMAFVVPPAADGSFTAVSVVPRHGGEVNLRLQGRMAVGGGSPKEFTGARYLAYSRDPMSRLPFGQGRPTNELIDDDQMANYLTVPRSLSPKVGELARQLTEGMTTPMNKAIAIMEWLRKTHTYTTDLKRDPSVADPLEDFLFHETAGHCEYFASATAVLLRLAGVPSRYINGFLGGEWNDLGKYLVVRDNRAHSWAEVYAGAAGWVRVDATPAAAVTSHMGRLRQLIDSVEFYWSRWIIDYDVSRQVEIAKRIGGTVGGGSGGIDMADAKRAARWGLGSAAVVGLAAFLFRRFRGRLRWKTGPGRASRNGRSTPAVYRLYEQTLVRVGRLGFVRESGETPREFALRLNTAALPGAAAVTGLTEHYIAARFGERDVPPEVLATLERQLADIGRGASTSGDPGRPQAA